MPLLQRVLLALPVFCALLCHAIALDRWLLAIPSAIGLVFAVLRSNPSITTSRQWYVVTGAGLLVGLIVPAAEVSAGPLPPAAAAALTGVATAIALFAVYTEKTTVAWAAGWALVTISGEIEIGGPLRVALIGFLLTSLLAMAFHARLVGSRIRGWLVLGAFAATLGLATAGIAALVQRIDRVFLNSVENFVANNTGSNTTGLGNSLSLNAKSTITPSMEPLLELSEMTGLLRAKVMDEFDGSHWTTSTELMARTRDLDGRLDGSTSSRDVEMIFLDVLDNSIPSPAGTSSVRNAKSSVIGGWILRGKPDHVSVSLGGDSTEQLREERIAEVDYLGLPDELKNGLGPLAIKLTADANSNLAQAESITAFFQDNFEYSLTTNLSGENHPLVTLVEKRSPAYCVYFASAMALMLRSQGVPTRIVTGFVPGEVNPLSGKVIVRGRDTHAWVEVWSPEDNRFVPFDPTPSSSRQQVMGHDKPLNVLTAFVGAIRSAMRRIWLLLRYQPSKGMVALLMSPLFWLGLGLLLVIIVTRRLRKVAAQLTTNKASVDPIMRNIYDRYQLSLRKAGVAPRASETDDELLVRIAALEDPPLLDAAREFLGRYRAARFGAQGTGIDVDLEEGVDLEELAKLKR